MTTDTATTILVRTSDSPQERLKWLHGTLGLTWREIANLDDYRGIPAGTLCSYANGVEPKRKHRQQLGLPPLSEVIYLDGKLPTGQAISIGVSVCECGILYISNHPARRRCFICRPYGGKRE